MQTVIEVSYGKKLCLPNYCNHTFSALIRKELPKGADEQAEVQKLYDTLQATVDEKMQAVGFVPDPRNYGTPLPSPAQADPSSWACTDVQRATIVNLAQSQGMKGGELNGLSKEMFKKPAKQLNPMQATELAFELRKRRNGVPVIDPTESPKS